MLNRSKTGLELIFWTGLDQVGWKLVFRTDFEELSLDYRRQIKPGQFYTAIHLTIWAVQNGPGMLNRNKTGLTLLFWTGLDLVRWKLVFRTDFEKHSLDYRRKLKPGQFCTTLLCRMVRPCRMVRASKIVLNGNGVPVLDCFWTKLDTNSYLDRYWRERWPITTKTQTRTFLHSYTFDNISRAEWSGHVKS